MFVTGNRIIDEDINAIIDEKLNWKFFTGKKILITGANGMLPSYIVYTLLGLNGKILKDNPLKVYALVRNKKKAETKFSSLLERHDFQLIVEDVTTFNSFNEGLNIIIHAASQASPKFYGVDPVGTLKSNIVGTMNLLEVARVQNCDRFIFVSSGDVYGELDGSMFPITETYRGNVDCANVRSCYGESKRMGETMCVAYAHQYGIHSNMVRLAHTYGPGCDLDDGRVFADFTKNVLCNENIKINSDGSAKRCFMYVTDMIKGLFYVILRANSGEAYNISSMREISIKELANILCNLYPEKKLRVEFLKTKDDNSYVRSKSQNCLLENKKLRLLGWQETVPVEVGFKRMIDSYKQEGF